ncbi:MAG: ABC transporter ATP-binding protein [bacterium]
MPEVVLECSNLTKTFRSSSDSFGFGSLFSKKTVYALKNVSFQVYKGEIFGIVGPNGSGKSTLVRVITNLLLPDSGYVKVKGMDVQKNEMKVRRLIGRVSVEASFFKRLSVMENLLFSARLYNIKSKVAKERIKKIMDRLLFHFDYIDEPLEDLSRGMQQKVAVARAFMTEPEMLLLDEPTTGLDPVSKKDVQEFIVYVRNELGTTILLCSHDMAEVDRICDRIAIIIDGEFVKVDTAAGLKSLVRGIENPTMEDVFIQVTGKQWKEVERNGP